MHKIEHLERLNGIELKLRIRVAHVGQNKHLLMVRANSSRPNANYAENVIDENRNEYEM